MKKIIQRQLFHDLAVTIGLLFVTTGLTFILFYFISQSPAVGDCAKQVGTHFFLFCFHQLFFMKCKNFCLLLQIGCSSAGDGREGQHADECKRIVIYRKIQSEIWISKETID